MLYLYFDNFVLLIHLYKHQSLISTMFFLNKNFTYKEMFLIHEQNLDHYLIEYVFYQFPNPNLVAQHHQLFGIVPNWIILNSSSRTKACSNLNILFFCIHFNYSNKKKKTTIMFPLPTVNGDNWINE